MDKKPRDLTAWKEIATRLQVSVRTAQLWEKERGLPVRRVPGSHGRVYLREDDLSAWLGDNASDRPARHESTSSRSWRIAARVAAVLIAMLLVMLTTTAGWWSDADSGRPAGWRVEGNALVVTNAAGAELWRFHFPERLASQTVDLEPLFEDLNGDGQLEVIFPYRSASNTGSDVLFCFTARGEEVWRYQPSAQIATETEEFENKYLFGSAIRAVHLGDGTVAVAVVIHHYLYYPTQVAVLSSDGAVLADYWHPGHIGVLRDHFAVSDLDNNGVDEIYATGVNNARERATLVVLDPDTMRGANLEDAPKYRFKSMAEGREIGRILFGRSAISEIDDRYNAGINVIAGDANVTVQVLESLANPLNPSVHYEFGADLDFHKLSLSDTFLGVHRRMVREGLLSRSLAEEERLLGAAITVVRRSGH